MRLLRSRPARSRLAGLPTFAGVTPRDLAVLESLFTEVSVPAGDLLLVEGRHSRQFVVLREGRLVVTRDGGEVAVLEAGDFAGEISLLSGGTPGATVRAAVPSRVLVASGPEFRAALAASPALAARVQRAAATRSTPTAG